MAATPSFYDRLLQSFRLLIGAETAYLRFLGTYEYAVRASSGATVDVIPIDTSLGLPSPTGLPLKASILGESVTVIPSGTTCRLVFLDGNPSKPRIVGVDAAPATSTIDASLSMSLAPSAASVTLGKSAASVSVGPAPVSLALAVPVETALSALGALFTTLSATMSSGPGSTSYVAFVTAAQPAFATAAAAMASAGASTPTTVLKGT